MHSNYKLRDRNGDVCGYVRVVAGSGGKWNLVINDRRRDYVKEYSDRGLALYVAKECATVKYMVKREFE